VAFHVNNLPLLITVLGCTKGKEVSPEQLDKYLGQFSESDVCLKCRVDAAFEVQEKLKYWRKAFVNLDSSPYLGKMGVTQCAPVKSPRSASRPPVNQHNEDVLPTTS